MFCPNCGTNVPDDAEFCSNCGYGLKTGQAPRPNAPYAPSQPYAQPFFNIPTKSEILTILLAFLIPGAGHLYVGRLTRGLIVLVSYFGITAISMIVLFTSIPGFASGDVSDIMNNTGLIAIVSVLSIIALVIWIVQLIDAYNLTKQYNDTVRRTGQAPW